MSEIKPMSIVFTVLIFSLVGISFSVSDRWKNILEYSNAVIFRLTKQDLKHSAQDSIIENSSERGT